MRTRARLTRTLALTILALFAAAVPAWAADGKVIITGQVLCGPDRRPAPDLHLAIYKGESGKKGYNPTVVETDAEGRFSLSALPGTFYVRVTERPTLGRPKYADYHLPLFDEPVEVVAPDPANPPPPVKIVLELGARVTGRAVRRDGTPFEKAGVGGQEMGSGGEIDPQGRFTILGLPAGADQEIHVFPLLRDYQYIRLVRVAGKDLKPGGIADVGDVVFDPLPEKANFRGTLSNADGTPYLGLTAVVLHDKAGLYKFGTNVREGKFEGSILPGEYRITTLSQGDGLPLGNVSIKEGRVAELDLKVPAK